MALAGRVAIVTGGGRGIGRAVAMELAEQGAAVVVVAQTEREIAAVADEVRANGRGDALALPMDISTPDGFDRLVQQATAWKAAPDILINNAGIRGPVAFIQNVPTEEFEKVFQVNVFGTFRGVRAVLPNMIERRWGRIVNLSGGGAWNGIRGGGPYGASKSALEGLTRTIALETQRFGVTCNIIQPGRVDTATFPILEQEAARGGVVGPEHAARCIAWLCSDEAADITGLTINSVEWDQERSAGSSGADAARAVGTGEMGAVRR